MHVKLKQTLAGAATLAAAAGVLPLLAASPAAAATNNGAIVISPASGNSDTAFQVAFPTAAGGQCAGDSATNNYKVQSFVVPLSTNLDSLVFNAQGPIGGQPLYFTSSDPLVNGQTDINTGNISQLPNNFTFGFNSPGDYAPGNYSVGVACTQGTGAGMTKSYWSTPVAITTNTTTGGAAQIDYAPYVAPLAAPTNLVVTNGPGQVSVAFTPSAGAPAGTTYTLTASAGGTVAGTATGAGSPLVITGLTNGTSYDLSLVAKNGTQTSPAATGTGTPNFAANPAPSVSLTPGVNSLTANIAPNGGTPDHYTVSITAPAGAAPAQDTTGAPVTFTGLDPATQYTVSVQAVYTDGSTNPSAATAQGYPQNSQTTVTQNIKGTRPSQGGLVLTQDCGADPTCTVDLGTGVLDAYGQYYVATGQMHPVTLKDYRDGDPGWTVNGDLADTFQSESGSGSFSGQALGWDPAVSFITPALANGYTMTVNEGATIAPWSSNALVAGSAVLMSAPAGHGIGTATSGAGLTLWIPVSAPAGTYDALLTLTAS